MSETSTTKPHLRDVLATMPTYRPGKPAAAVAGLTAYKISSNENPYPPLPGVLDEVKATAESFNRYPNMFCEGLIARIADHVNLDPGWVAVGPGSVGILGQILTSVCGPGDEVVYAWRAFEAYPILIDLNGATKVPVPLTSDARHDLPAMAAAVTANTKVVLLCTPNNPTGTVIHRAELETFLDAVPPSVLVVIDEAYLEFVRDPETPEAQAVLAARPNVMILRTFSKAYGLAGLRVGYALAQPEIAEALMKSIIPFSVSQLAQDAAIASLDSVQALSDRVAVIVDERTRVAQALADQGWDLPTSQGNFVWLPLGERTMEFAAACGAQALAVRPFAGEGARCSIGEPEASDRLLTIAAQFVPGKE